jgi:hypothetical protein
LAQRKSVARARSLDCADELDRGDSLLTADGHKVRVKSIRHGSEKIATVYNLTIDDVLAGFGTQVAVHLGS